jgi:hypothetical protein
MQNAVGQHPLPYSVIDGQQVTPPRRFVRFGRTWEVIDESTDDSQDQGYVHAQIADIVPYSEDWIEMSLEHDQHGDVAEWYSGGNADVPAGAYDHAYTKAITSKQKE